RSLPMGWLPSAFPQEGQGVRSRDIAVVPTGRVVVHLDIVPDSTGSGVDVDLGAIAAVLKGDGGRPWAGVMGQDTTVLFEALPVGTYELRLDLDALEEPLRITEALPMVRVVEGGGQVDIRVVLEPRPLRIDFRAKSVRLP